MDRLDIEQQLRQLEKKGGDVSSFDAVQVSFMKKEYYDSVGQVSVFILMAGALASLLFLIPSVFPAKVTKRYAKNIAAAKLTFFASLTPLHTSLFTAAWVLLVGVNGVLSLMKHSAALHEERRKADPSIGAPKELTMAELLPSAPFVIFVLEFAGIVVEWVTYALGGTLQDVPLLSSLLVFFPSLYQSLALDSTAPDRMPLWLTHCVLFTTLFVLFCLAKTFVMVNYKLIKEEYNKHVTTALYKDRKEMRDLKSRPDIMQRRSAALKKRS